MKIFITHGGLLSTQESIYHATPVIALPVFADQPRNAYKMAVNGYGVMIDWEELTVDILLKNIKTILEDPRLAKFEF